MKNIYLGNNIKYLRIKKKITQQQIAEYLGKTDGAVSFWESGSREPNLEDLIKLSKIFEVSIDDLILKNFRGGK